MVTALGILIALLSAVYVALPLLRPEGPEEDVPLAAPGERERWDRYKAEAYAAIKEAEFDREMGKLSEEDFRIVRDKYAAQAIEAIAALDRAAQASRRGAGRAPKRVAFCPSCGTQAAQKSNFCAACGASLREALAG